MFGPKLSRMRASTSGAAIRPIGTLIQKIQVQSSPLTTAPPTIGPLATAIPVTALNRPIAVPRFSAGKAALNSARPRDIMNAAPTPWTARAAISQPTLGEAAQAAEASANPTIPTAYNRRRPKRSPRAAAVTSITAKLRL